MQNALSSLKGMVNSLVISSQVEKCKEVCQDSLDELAPKDCQVIKDLVQDILQAAPDLIASFKEQGQQMLQQARAMDATDATWLMDKTTAFLKQESTRRLVRTAIDRYGAEILKSEARMKAVGSYLRCVVSHIEPQYKQTLLSAVDMVLALVALVASEPKVQSFATKLNAAVQKNVVAPVVQDVKDVNARNAATGGGGRAQRRRPSTAPATSSAQRGAGSARGYLPMGQQQKGQQQKQHAKPAASKKQQQKQSRSSSSSRAISPSRKRA